MRRLSCSVLVGVLVVAAGALAEEALACTVTVQPGQSIQAAIAGAQEGAVICLGEGSWQENLKIEKALTLRGQGAQKTVIDGIQGGYPVVWVVGVQPIEVKLEGLEVTGAEGECADWPICASGMLIQGTARAEITNSTISGNRRDGIELVGTAQAEITGSTISKNGDGIGLFDSAQAKITNSTISENENIFAGIELWGTAQAEITDSTISENWIGIVLEDSAQAEITTSTISDNGADGILLLEKAILRLTESHLLRNQGYGVSAHLPGCVEDSQSALRFTGEVSGRGNTIPGPAEPEGNKKGAVCPAELAFLMTKEGGRYP
jgi:parallel beta-helix repeat protein